MKQFLATLMVVMTAGASFAYQDKKLNDAVAKAQDLVRKGRPEEGVKNLQKVVTGLNTGEAWVALGRFQESQGDPEQATVAFGKARLVGAADPDVLAAVAGYTLASGKAKDAHAVAEAAVKAGRTPESLSILSRSLVRLNRAAEAHKVADEAIAMAPTNPAGYLAKGNACLATRQEDPALVAYRKALELDPEFTPARVALASALIVEGKPSEAVVEARKATVAAPKLGEAFAVLGHAIYAEKPKDPQAWTAAIGEAQQGAFLSPKNALVQFTVATLFEAQPNPQMAAQHYKNTLEIDPSFAEARVALINLQVTNGEFKNAVAEAEKLVQEEPGSGDVWFLLGKTYLRLQDYKKAVAPLEKAVTLAPGIPEAHIFLGTCYNQIGKAKEAADAYRKGLAIKDDPSWRADLGFFLSQAGEQEQAIAELKKVVASNVPKAVSVAAYANLGYAYKSAKQYAEAAAAYKKALEIDPKEEQAAFGLGWSYLQGEKWDEAIGAFNQMIQIEPKLAAEGYEPMVYAYLRKGDMAQAKATAEKLKAAGRDNARALADIAKWEKAMADGDLARKKFEEEIRNQQNAQERIARLLSQTRSKTASVRAQAARELGGLAGEESGRTLVWLMQNDEDWGVKQAAAESVGRIGFKAAVPYLRSGMNQNCDPGLTGVTKEALENSMKCEDYRRVCRDALAKMR